MINNDVMSALSAIERTEANLDKIERIWSELQELLPAGGDTADNGEYENRARSFDLLVDGLPAIAGWKPRLAAPDLDALSQTRLDLMELGDPAEQALFERALWSEGRQIREYRFHVHRLRRQLVRSRLLNAMSEIEAQISGLKLEAEAMGIERLARVPSERWLVLSSIANQIDVMFGSRLFPQNNWGNFKRHVRFACRNDLDDIEKYDWPFVRKKIESALYGDDEPVPVDVLDLSSLIAAETNGEVITSLQWQNIDAAEFERLIYTLVSSAQGYENVEWSMHTTAPDKGRDLSAFRVQSDALSGVDRKRIVIQCKHWMTRSISQSDAYLAMSQTAMWTNPRVDVLVLATSGRFTADALVWIEQHNASSGMPKIELWAESHLEALLATKPAIVAEFGLRRTNTTE